MIKFFRNIRKQMLKRGKTANYLKYAIGEIILVVIGILIALSINNWNQNRINIVIEKEYYERFLNDVSLDKSIIIQQIEYTKSRLEGAHNMLALLQKDSMDLSLISKEIGQSVSRANFEFKPTQTAYEDVKSSGNLNLIKDLVLKNELDQYYSNVSGLMNTIISNSSKLADRMLLKDDLLGTGFANIAFSQKNAMNPTIVDIKKLEKHMRLTEKKRIELMNDAVLYAGINSRNIEHFNVILDEIIKIKNQLEIKCNVIDK